MFIYTYIHIYIYILLLEFSANDSRQDDARLIFLYLPPLKTCVLTEFAQSEKKTKINLAAYEYKYKIVSTVGQKRAS